MVFQFLVVIRFPNPFSRTSMDLGVLPLAPRVSTLQTSWADASKILKSMVGDS